MRWLDRSMQIHVSTDMFCKVFHCARRRIWYT